MARARRLVALAAALGLAAAGTVLAISPVVADTGDITYNCKIPTYNVDQDIDISLSTNAPAEMVVGETFDPVLNVKVVIPSSIIGLAKLFGYTHASAVGALTVGVNGTAVSLPATYPKTKIPASGDFVVDIPIPLPQLKPTQAGLFTYTPGPLSATLTVYKGENGSADSIQANCAVKNPSPGLVIDTVTVSEISTPPGKASTATALTTAGTTYGKPGRVTVRVTGGQGITGQVVLSGAGPRQTKQVGADGTVAFILTKTLLARTYTLKAAYLGNSTFSGSSKTRSFKVAKGSVAGIGFGLGSKPTSKRTGTGTVMVQAPAGLKTATGKVTLVLTKGGVTKTVTGTLASGKKTLVLPKLGKGTWTVAVKYAGDADYGASSRLFRFTVTR